MKSIQLSKIHIKWWVIIGYTIMPIGLAFIAHNQQWLLFAFVLSCIVFSHLVMYAAYDEALRYHEKMNEE